MPESPLAEFTKWFTVLATEWNRCERSGQYMLAGLLGGSPTAHAVCCELKNVQLTNGLSAAAKLRDREVGDAIDRFCGVFERLRAYRNFVIHGMQEFPDETSQRGEGVAVLATESGKGSFKVGTQAVDASDLRAIAGYIDATRSFGDQIIRALEDAEPLPSLETLPLPARMAKNVRSHPMLKPPPQSSGA